MSVVIETTIGQFTVDLFLKERPKASLNFLKLCKLKYYNFNLFHSIQAGFIAQTGDPAGLGGNGGESIWGLLEGKQKKYFEAETVPKIRHAEPGLLSMVSAGKDLISSQFLLTLGPDLTSLDGVHCVIGEVVEGHEVLRKLNEAICDDKFRPYQDIRITHTVVLDDPYADPRGFREPSRSPSPSAERLKNGRIAADEDIDDTEGKTPEEIQEMLEQREAKARATILEIVGDLPDADIAPPENVLFVCKLNPVTTDDDLQIIFSRFGKIKGCEVIRDKTSNDSLQYAFIEFEEKKSCEDAYFKMDNVLIDDRRIHVDFSQSVSKYKWQGKGRGVVVQEGADNRYDTRKRDYRRKSHLSPSRSRSRSGSRSPKRGGRNRSPRRDNNRRDAGYRNNYNQNNRYRNNNFNNYNRNRNFQRNQGRYGRSPRRQYYTNNQQRDFRNYHNWKYDKKDSRARDDSRSRSRTPAKKDDRSRSRSHSRGGGRGGGGGGGRKSRSRSRDRGRMYDAKSSSTRNKSRSPVRNKSPAAARPVSVGGSDSDYEKRNKQVKKPRKASTPPRARTPPSERRDRSRSAASTPDKKKKKRSKHKSKRSSSSDSSSDDERRKKKKKSKKSSR